MTSPELMSSELTIERTLRTSAYRERDQLIAALSKIFPSHLSIHTGDWEEEWRNIVCIHLPTGQATWHIQEDELCMFNHLDHNDSCKWDGHTTEEKYERLRQL